MSATSSLRTESCLCYYPYIGAACNVTRWALLVCPIVTIICEGVCRINTLHLAPVAVISDPTILLSTVCGLLTENCL